MCEAVRVLHSALHVEDSGEGGPTLIFLHYFAGSSRAWTPVVSRLEAQRRCLALDLAGFGRSQTATSRDSVDAHADDVEQAAEERQAGPYILVGHSMGGKIAAALAARRPSNLRGLMLLAPSPLTPEPIDEADRCDALAAHGDRAVAEALLGKITCRRLEGREREGVLHDSLNTSSEAWRWWLESGSREDLGERSREITVPTLLVAGEQDFALAPDVHRRTAQRLGCGAPPVLIPACGHLVPLEAPDEAAALITGFGERIASAALAGHGGASPSK